MLRVNVRPLEQPPRQRSLPFHCLYISELISYPPRSLCFHLLSPWPSKNLPGSFLPQDLFICCSLTYSLPYLLWVFAQLSFSVVFLDYVFKTAPPHPTLTPILVPAALLKSLSCLHFPIGVSSSVLHSLLLNSVYRLFLTMDLFFMPRIVPSHSRHLRNCLND